MNPTGICLSGGGIRAAAFGLGALEAIQEQTGLVQGSPGKPDDAADYLVAVSGGSYIAGAVSMLRSPFHEHQPPGAVDAGEADNPPTDHPQVFDPRSDEVEFVRRRAQYLLRGGGGIVELIAQFTMRLALNLCFVGLPVLALGILSGLLFHRYYEALPRDHVGLARWPITVALIALVFGLAVALWVVLFPETMAPRTARRWTSWGVGIGLVGLLIGVIPDIVSGLTPDTPHARAATVQHAGGIAVVATAGSIVTAVAALLTKAQPLVNAIGRFPRLRAFGTKALHMLVVAAAAVLAPVALIALYIYVIQRTTATQHWSRSLALAGVLAAVWALILLLAEPTRWSLHPFYERRLMSCFCIGSRPDDGLGVSARNPKVRYVWSGWDLPPRPELIIAAAANLSTFGSAPAGENVRPFAMSKHEVGFTNGWTHGTAGAAESIPGVGPRFITDELLASCGASRRRLIFSWRNGRRNLANLTLPAAVAITGAAVSPSMGKRTIPPIRMLLALFNLRLGVWLPNPENASVREAVANGDALNRAPHALYLAREFLGLNSERAGFVYVSDGGHYENLGLVETLRRGCTRVYCIDASGDPPGQPRTLTEAMRLAAAELALTWDRSCSQALAKLTVSDDAPADTGKIKTPPHVQRTWTRLAFRTADGTPGHVIVIKASIGPETPAHLSGFQTSHPTFPYDGTGNQLFRAERFDAYRELGYSSAMSALKQPGQ